MLTNTRQSYGTVARTFHWVIALLILTDIALGLIGDALPRNAETVPTLTTLYSLHKTIGVSVLLLAVLRLAWALIQPRPVPLHPERRAETLAAETVHWALYGAILIMPLSGWVMHAAESGFAPIWWPFGQGLPFVPKSEAVAHTAGALHGLAAWVIYITVGLHIVGALKHAVIDRDETLARMTKGVAAGDATTHHGLLAPLIALLLWGAVVGSVFVGGPQEAHQAEAAAAQTETAQETLGAASDAPVWTVTEGDITFAVTQMGSPVEGHFGTWDAQINYDEARQTGEVQVVIDTTSLELGSVTAQAKGPEFFDVDAYTSAVFDAEINGDEAVGILDLAGQTAPVTLPFELTITDDVAQMSGTVALDRRDFGMGAGYADESTVGFAVTVDVNLTAERAE